jgi:hypothetical protein
MRTLAMVILVAASGCRTLLGIDDPLLIDAPSPPDDVSDGPPEPPGDALQNACPSSYGMTLATNTSRYRVSLTTEDWVAAATTCAGDLNTIGPFYTHLAVPDDAAEVTGLFNLAGVTAWVGHHDRRTEGVFETVSAQNTPNFPPAPSQPPWGSGEPNNAAGNQDCVRIRGPADPPANTLDDEDCTIPFAYIVSVRWTAPA